MDITVNGNTAAISVDTIAAYVADCGLASETLVVEHNGQVIAADQWGSIRLREGDQLELLNFVGGG